jgi:hypothetical protein
MFSLNDVHRIFYECLKDQVEAEKGQFPERETRTAIGSEFERNL